MSAAKKFAPRFREVRVQVPDVESPGFREDIARQVTLLNAAGEEGDILAFLDAAWNDIDAAASAAEEAAGVPHPWSAAT